MTTPCLLLSHEDADGPANMALDEAMLDAVAADSADACFRTYGWTVPTLSLGYFQSITDARREPRWRDVPTVRRPTGGGALWHDREVTYALALPRRHPLAHGGRSLYRAVHDAIAALLRAEGIRAARRGEDATGTIQEVRPFLCFTGHDAEDIVADGVKLVGSAQRRREGAVLQHGALLLAHSPLTPELRGVEDLAPASREGEYWREALRRGLLRALDLERRDHCVPDGLYARARDLEDRVYRTDAWTARR